MSDVTYPDLPADLDPAARRAALRTYMDACRAKLASDPARMQEIRAKASSYLAYGAWQQLRTETPRVRRRPIAVAPPPAPEAPAKRVAELAAVPPEPKERKDRRITSRPLKQRGRKPGDFDIRTGRKSVVPVPRTARETIEYVHGRGTTTTHELAAHFGIAKTSAGYRVLNMVDNGLLVYVGDAPEFKDVRGCPHPGPRLYAVPDAVAKEWLGESEGIGV